MKKFSFLAMAVAGMLLGACSSDKDVADNGGGKDILSEKGVGYIKVGLNLPTTSAVTRAWSENTDLDDGVSDEYAVEDATLLIFSGASESEAKLVQISSLLKTPWESVTGSVNQVTTKHEETVELKTTEGNLYALAVINSSGIIEGGTTVKDIKILGTEKDFTTTGNEVKIGDLQAAIASATAGVSKFYDATNKRIFMTNAVLSNVRGGTGNPGAYPGSDASVTDLHILAPINKSYIYETKAEADATGAKAAADIYVERAVAKVTMTIDDAPTIDGPKVVTGTLSVGFDGWTLANTSVESYVVRQVPAYTANTFEWNFINDNATSAEKYRFVGTNAVDIEYGTDIAGYRTYWAKDPKYDADVAAGDLYTPDLTADASYKAAKETVDGVTSLVPQYCNENTFDVQRQAYKNTTTAVLKVTYKVGGSAATLYSVGVDKKTFYTEADVKTLVVNALMANSDFKDWLTTNRKEETFTKITIADINSITFGTRDANTGEVKVTEIELKTDNLKSGAKTKMTEIDSEISKDILTSVGSAIGTIKSYVDGVSYYAIRIQHFGNDLTPWQGITVNGVEPAESTIDLIYPKSSTGTDAEKKAANNAYLGRYGVVRNNWYDIKVDKIVKIGSATPKELKLDGDHPDDELEEAYIRARINILSWAKRPQSWNLK